MRRVEERTIQRAKPLCPTRRRDNVRVRPPIHRKANARVERTSLRWAHRLNAQSTARWSPKSIVVRRQWWVCAEVLQAQCGERCSLLLRQRMPRTRLREKSLSLRVLVRPASRPPPLWRIRVRHTRRAASRAKRGTAESKSRSKNNLFFVTFAKASNPKLGGKAGVLESFSNTSSISDVIVLVSCDTSSL